MAYIEYTTDCCGICEAIGMNDTKWSPEEFLKDCLMEDLEEGNERIILEKKHMLFSIAFRRAGTKVSRRAEELKEYIESNNLGTVVLTPRKKNSSGNWVIAGIFTADITPLRAWVKEKFPEDEDTDDPKLIRGYDPKGCNCITCRKDRIAYGY